MSVRQLKMASQIRRLVGDLLTRGVTDPRIDGLLTVTKVELTPDLREARVFVSVLGATRPTATVLSGLQSATRWIQAEVARGLPVRYMPHLQFLLDETLKKEAELFRTIDQVVRQRDTQPRPDSDADRTQDAG